MLVARHSFVGELGQEHGDERRKAPLRSQLVRAHPCQPQDVLGDVRGLALEHSPLVQTQSGRGEATEGGWDGQTHAGEEATPPRRVLILGPLENGRATEGKNFLREKTREKGRRPRCASPSYRYHTDSLRKYGQTSGGFVGEPRLRSYRCGRDALKATFHSDNRDF